MNTEEELNKSIIKLSEEINNFQNLINKKVKETNDKLSVTAPLYVYKTICSELVNIKNYKIERFEDIKESDLFKCIEVLEKIYPRLKVK